MDLGDCLHNQMYCRIFSQSGPLKHRIVLCEIFRQNSLLFERGFEFKSAGEGDQEDCSTAVSRKEHQKQNQKQVEKFQTGEDNGKSVRQNGSMRRSEDVTSTHDLLGGGGDIHSKIGVATEA
ncbi:hypothetical protein CEXT_296391 [Caerostris extrusa]|uniref:Uncharacterized protein n=1 Tax=Caerostris extrusa TaxID=172846 RepID=A0AAV4U9V0_CAEEX|nr:hypothetical protein CEXT_296391 [Caerostris extrusa]